ncbi:MAG: thioredoxin family protein [Phycisphaerae bacterium]|nr:thioredoxin family protein [Phycisphaerae bacterium]
MNNTARIGIVVALAVAIGIVVVAKHGKKSSSTTAGTPATASAPTAAGLPRLVDLGANQCIPCKKMAPILEELRKEFAGRLQVDFIDVWENPKAGDEYHIKLIPTQIFFDASGKELFRHEGFFSRENILGKWKELGVDLTGKPAASIERATPTAADTRAKDSICFMCDGGVSPKSRVLVKGQTEQITLCSPHGFFINEASLKAWLEKHPTATGRMVTIGQALAAKMNMTPAQIAGACKIGECK